MANRKHELKHKQAYLRSHAFNFCCFCRGFCLSILRNDRPFPNCLLLPFASVSNRVLVHNVSYKLKMSLICMKWTYTRNTFSRQWFCKKTRFDIQSKVNSQMAFYSIPPSYAYGPLQRPSCLCQPCLCNFQRTTIVLALFNVLSVLC